MFKFILLFSILLLTACSSMRAKVDYHNPSENHINIEGNILSSLTYKVKVQYVTKSELKSCKNYNWLAGLYVSQSTEYEYRPTIENGKHRLHIPLKKLNPNTECQWTPNVVHLCAAQQGTEPSSCSSLFFLRGQHDNNPEIDVECTKSGFCFRKPFELHTEDINIFNTTYPVNISEKKT